MIDLIILNRKISLQLVSYVDPLETAAPCQTEYNILLTANSALKIKHQITNY